MTQAVTRCRDCSNSEYESTTTISNSFSPIRFTLIGIDSDYRARLYAGLYYLGGLGTLHYLER